MVRAGHTHINELNAMLVEIPLLMGYSPAHWHHGLNFMLKKILGNYKVDWL